ncbi:DUF600 family protein [Vibrio sp. RE86]|uniref:immunity protein YezG family protein n=1 Tax=Vibrio sp. RE86 TaxID=2607605 RepID=UPI0014936F7D|nr:DUF600 family protein [Vibrio sp. RE86]
MNTAKNPQEIYKEIGNLIWSIFPEEGVESCFTCQVYDSFKDYTFDWSDEKGIKQWFGFEDSPDDVFYLILKQLELLQQHPIFAKERWTHCKVTLTDEGKFSINFAYIDKEDSWSGLYMRGVSSLTKEEAEIYHVPEDVWEERQVQS